MLKEASSSFILQTEVVLYCSEARCDHFDKLFVDKISGLPSNLDSTLTMAGLDGPGVMICSVVWGTSQLVHMDRIVGCLRHVTCLCEPCSFWLLKSTGGGWRIGPP